MLVLFCLSPKAFLCVPLCYTIPCVPLEFLTLGSQNVLVFVKSYSTALEDELLLYLFHNGGKEDTTNSVWVA